MRRVLRILVIAAVLVTSSAVGYVAYTTRRMLPITVGTLMISGLDDRVEVVRDAWGVPHIYAHTAHDLFMAQGFVHAQDRWWQMEFNRHVSLGRIGELTGQNDSVQSTDIFIRTVGWQRDAQRDLDNAPAETLSVANAYASGVNAYITGKPGADLAIEYTLLGATGVSIPIQPWEPLHSFAWGNALAWDLSGDLGDELFSAKLAKKFGDTFMERMRTLMPDFAYDLNPTILYPEDVPTGESVRVRQPLTSTDYAEISTHLVGGAQLENVMHLGVKGEIGSNNWVISGSRTASGMPLLANDTHLGIQMPSIWYMVGLHCAPVSAECPYDMQGFSFAGVPGIVIGHNARIAWGVTNLGPDTQDTYIIQVDPTDDTRYIVDGVSQQMTIYNETIRFGDGTPPLDVRVRETVFGPIITDSPTHDDLSNLYQRPLALRYAAQAQPKDLIGVALAVGRASNWDEFRSALRGWNTPSQNFIYADVDGNIGYQAPGNLPIRAPGHTGMLPIDGSTTEYMWRGFIPYDELPTIYNPERGFIVTANQNVVPLVYYDQLADRLGAEFGDDAQYEFGYHFAAGYRARRITDLITQSDNHTVESMRNIHADTFNAGAQVVVPALINLQGLDVPADVVTWLSTWDLQNHADSGQAALYEMTWREIRQRVWGDELGETPLSGELYTAIRILLDEPNNPWWDDVTTEASETRDDILRSAFSAGYARTVTALGTDYKAWKWGSLHTATFVSNPLGLSGIGVVESLVNAGPVAIGGGPEIVNAVSYEPEDFGATNIPSMRMIVDFAEFEHSEWITTTGNSGHPSSQHYRDMIEPYRTGQNIPMLWQRSTITVTDTLVLVPAN
jgi:penicillin G amidase